MARSKRYIPEKELVNLTEKKCTRCEVIKEKIEFSNCFWRAITAYCKDCHRQSSKNRRYIERDVSILEMRCSRCKEIKIIKDFPPHALKLRSPYCQNCIKNNSTIDYQRNRSHLKRKFNLAIEDYELMIKNQNNKCAICNKEETSVGTKIPKVPRRLAVDHNHSTGKVRALLCHACNVLIGLAKDDSSILRKGAEYLEKHK